MNVVASMTITITNTEYGPGAAAATLARGAPTPWPGPLREPPHWLREGQACAAATLTRGTPLPWRGPLWEPPPRLEDDVQHEVKLEEAGREVHQPGARNGFDGPTATVLSGSPAPATRELSGGEHRCT